ncbi:unnamed protein product [Linum tenue]|uniref:Uncharacterized protein n=1 Tax=Linum tenue TaxID=586396 RepID=A0AAV0NYL6_9ROSI|nr:unnamed protein product [Linum tenue]CAI0463780.1 unnamed protein product [Linum tenue]
MSEQSKVLNTPGAQKQTKRELFDALRQELETPVLEKASKSVWELILDNNGLGKEISETVERVFCKLSGQEPPLFPPPSNHEPKVSRDKENKEETEKEEELTIASMKEKSLLKHSKKRRHSDMNMEKGGAANEVARKSADDRSSKSPHSKTLNLA